MSKNRHDMLRYQSVSCKYIRCPCLIVCLFVCVVNMYCIRVQCIPLSVSVHLSVCVVCTVSLFVLYFRTPFFIYNCKINPLKQHLSLRSLAKPIHTLRHILFVTLWSYNEFCLPLVGDIVLIVSLVQQGT